MPDTDRDSHSATFVLPPLLEMKSRSDQGPDSAYMNVRIPVHSIPLVAIAALSVIAFYYRDESLLQVKTMLQGLDLPTAALLFVGVSTVAALLLFPASLLMLFSGAYFGLWWGFAFNLLGFGGGAILAFLVSRHLARKLVTRLLPAYAHRALEALGTNGWQTVAVLRTIGIIPGVVVNYALGITPLGLFTYAWASLLFTLPNAFILTYAGVAGEDFVRNGELNQLLLAISLLATAAVVAGLLRKRFVRQP